QAYHLKVRSRTPKGLPQMRAEGIRNAG
ncbi:autoinducer synthase, partial [Rhodobacteraceae bacterium R_SAG5]|nr:autoinducer synthase [Rhodobacteraceae bacterium R_SAG5]